MAFDTEAFNNVSSGGGSTIKIWSYINLADTLATIMTASYFNGRRFALGLNDVVFIIGSDGSELVRITSAVNAASVTVTAYDAVPGGTITNADVSAGAAIDFSKLAALATGDFVVGNAGVPTASTMYGDATLAADGAVTLDADIPRTVSVAVSSAVFLAISGTPFQIVATGGADTMHVVEKVVLQTIFGTTQYANGGAVGLQYGNTAALAGSLCSATVAAATVNAYVASDSLSVEGLVTAGAVAGKVNQGLFLSCDTAEFITGDSSFIVHVTYSTVSTIPVV